MIFNNLWLAVGDGFGGGTGVIPVALIDVSASGAQPSFVFRNSMFNNMARIEQLVFGNANVIIDGGVWTGCQGQSQFNNAGIQIGCNYTGGVFTGGAQTFPILPGPVFGGGGRTLLSGTLKWMTPTRAGLMTTPAANPTTGQVMEPSYFYTFPNRAPWTQATTGFTDANGQNWTFAAGLGGAPTAGQFSSMAVTACDGSSAGGIFTGNFAQFTQESYDPRCELTWVISYT